MDTLGKDFTHFVDHSSSVTDMGEVDCKGGGGVGKDILCMRLRELPSGEFEPELPSTLVHVEKVLR